MRFISADIILYFFLLVLSLSGFFFAVAWPGALGFYSFIIIAAAGGFGVAAYIYWTKQSHRQLACPLGSDCNAVITSRYATFLTVPLEYWGMAYYGIIFFAYLIVVFSPFPLPALFLSGLAVLSAAAFLFSLYLLFVQAFLLGQWCIWCLLSAMLSTAIFIASLVSIKGAVVMLLDMAVAVEMVRTLGFIWGMGGMTAALFLFARFLKDHDIDDREVETLKGVSELIWSGLAIILVTQFVVFIASPETLSGSGTFLVQTVALFVVAVSGAALMIIFAPFLAIIPFNKDPERSSSPPLARLRTPLFVIGAFALSSWYAAFGMEYAPEVGFVVASSWYGALLALTIAAALVWEGRASKCLHSSMDSPEEHNYDNI